MPINPLRSIAFNTLFFLWSLLCCLFFIPFLAAPKRFVYIPVYTYLYGIRWLEEHVMDLHLEVRGKENIPSSGSYIIAAKHQSAYETFKLHFLFGRPAIVLKKELLSIPLWGQFLKKCDAIAIDRSSPGNAMASIKEGIAHVKKLGMPIVIFPQGTRVPASTQPCTKPYKTGVIRMYEADNELPIVPVAINTGHFWPKKGWKKRSGTVVIEILPPIPPGLPKNTVMERLQHDIEEKSCALVHEAQEKTIQNAQSKNKTTLRSKTLTAVVLIFSALFLHALVWQHFGQNIKHGYLNALSPLSGLKRENAEPLLSGFPDKWFLFSDKEKIISAYGHMSLENISVSVPVSFNPTVSFLAQNIRFADRHWDQELEFDFLELVASKRGDEIKIKDGLIRHGDFEASITGTAHYDSRTVPDFTLKLKMKNHHLMIDELTRREIIDQRYNSLLNNALQVFAKGEEVELTLRLKDHKIYAGPIPIGTLPDFTLDDLNRLPPEPPSKPDN